MKKILIALLAVGVLSGCVSNQVLANKEKKLKYPRWVMVTDSDSQLVYIDVNSVEGGEIKTAWSRVEFKKCSKKHKFCELFVQHKYDCKNRKSLFISGNAFKNGEVVMSTNTPDPDWIDFQPGTSGAAEFNLVCFNELD